ncbi:UDP-N-acetylmuramate dehydrogenase [Shewanella sp. MEBiC00475]|uniref:UDP-N-acetylmuramate dehydrogenase n=1 Tax=Shewanella sp. MEBiC00475 TaxID=2575361 RepID=UPI0010BFF6AC|nr:UDP-N-acetylmuramate dehydrogenase [Shewanella sp. MEBiC00475]
MSISLAVFNTLGLQQSCSSFVEVTHKAELVETCKDLYQQQLPMLILGGGSNIVFTDDFDGTVVKVATKGIQVTEDTDYYYLSVQAGENWHNLVEFCLNKQIYGLENLALIPGTVGAAPIQNIGAYGVEFNRFCYQVEFLQLDTGTLNHFDKDQCHFGYRDSIFKQQLKNLVVITEVTLRLNKQWQPIINYGPLQHFDPAQVTAKQIFDSVCKVRQAKLPDPKVLGNVGSFFKNPIVSSTCYELLKSRYAELVGYKQIDGRFKIAAGWLIDTAGLKGFNIGNAGVHKDQALVLVNLGNATGAEICQLARHIIQEVYDTFAVILEPEPRIMGSVEEIEIQ